MGVWGRAMIRYTVYGALFGAFFPLGAMLADIWLQGLPFTLTSIVSIQRSQPLHWLIDTAPLFLGLFAGIAGYRQEQLERSLHVLEERAHALEAALRRAERAEELAQLNQDNARLYAETERQLAALAQLATEREQHLETIRQLAMPIIPIADGMLVLPVIGALDIESVERLQAPVLERVAATNTHVLILDFTGVATITAAAVPAITRFFAALALRGTQTVLTGIHPALAQQLIEYDAAFVVPFIAATLATGVKIAEQLGRKL